jgi:ribosomal protein L16 Arg81 hydroxylase
MEFEDSKSTSLLEEIGVASYAQRLHRSVNLLDNVLSPMSGEEFIERYFGKSFLHIPGARGKFTNLVPWNELNRILEEHRLAPPRLKLFQAGKPIRSNKYLSATDKFGSVLQSAQLTNLLAQGATLIIDAFDELHMPVRQLAMELERVFRIQVQVNLYAGWRTDPGFLLHYDDHDTVVLQIAGRKHWKVYPPTRLYPLAEGKDVEVAEKPVGEPIWDDMFDDGGLFYIPRGWWHVASPIDEPTLHLTVGLRNHRGLDLLLWFANQLNNCLEVRQDVPHLAEPDIQAVYMERLRKQLCSAWSDDLLNRFLTSTDDTALSRPHFELPEAATAEGIAVRRKSRVRLIGPRRLDLSGKPENGNLKFAFSGKTLHCRAELLPVLEKLDDGRSHPVQELISLVIDWDADLIAFLQVLALHGFLTTASETD